MICMDCRQRADMNQGCSQACSVGCDCQHKAKPVVVAFQDSTGKVTHVLAREEHKEVVTDEE